MYILLQTLRIFLRLPGSESSGDTPLTIYIFMTSDFLQPKVNLDCSLLEFGQRQREGSRLTEKRQKVNLNE